MCDESPHTKRQMRGYVGAPPWRPTCRSGRGEVLRKGREVLRKPRCFGVKCYAKVAKVDRCGKFCNRR